MHTTHIHTLSLHDALPIWGKAEGGLVHQEQLRPRHQRARHGEHLLLAPGKRAGELGRALFQTRESGENSIDISTKTIDRKSTRLNSSHGYISYAVFCLKKK